MFDDVEPIPVMFTSSYPTAASAATVLNGCGQAGNDARLHVDDHDPSVFAFGNEHDSTMPSACSRHASILNVYARRCHKNRDEVAAMMTETTWMDSHKAHTGSVDGIVDMGSGISGLRPHSCTEGCTSQGQSLIERSRKDRTV